MVALLSKPNDHQKMSIAERAFARKRARLARKGVKFELQNAILRRIRITQEKTRRAIDSTLEFDPQGWEIA